ncbi:hypothetical protein ALC53_00807 [Atta colombica]|uniref:Uncharacterized protein n=1 Tax=Atta colombica TaxID=520822 RepID=A0A195BUU3_9HYME|nr:hypothetical protein ALC53_00807 [Atta colombica]
MYRSLKEDREVALSQLKNACARTCTYTRNVSMSNAMKLQLTSADGYHGFKGLKEEVKRRKEKESRKACLSLRRAVKWVRTGRGGADRCDSNLHSKDGSLDGGQDGIKEDHGHSPGDRIWNNFRGKYFRISLLESLDYLPLRQLIPIRKPSFLPFAQRAPFGYGTLIAKTRNERSVRMDHGIAGSTIAAAPDRPNVYKHKLVFAFSDRFCQPDLTALLIIN